MIDILTVFIIIHAFGPHHPVSCWYFPNWFVTFWWYDHPTKTGISSKEQLAGMDYLNQTGIIYKLSKCNSNIIFMGGSHK